MSSAGSRTGAVVDPATNAGEVWAGDVEGVRSQTPPPPYTEHDTGAFSDPDVSVPPPAYSETEPGTVHGGQDGSGADSAVGAGDGSKPHVSEPGRQDTVLSEDSSSSSAVVGAGHAGVPAGGTAGAALVGSGAGLSLAGLPSGVAEGARVVRVPEPTGTGTGGVSAERVRAQLGADVSTTGGPVVVASRAAAGGGVVMSPEQATTLARELGRDVVVLAPGRGRRGPRWMRFSANGGRPKPAADGVVVRPSEPDTSPTAPRTDLGSLAHASTAVPETAKPTTPATGSEDAAGPEALETAAVGADLGGPGRPVAGSEPATRGEVSDADGPAMPAGAESGVEDGSVDSVTAEAGSGVGDTSAESVSTASTSRPEPGRSESAGAVDARKEAVRIVRDTHDPVKLARSPEVVSVDEVIERIAALVREHGPAWARQYSQELADELGTAGRAYGIRGGAGPEPTAQPGNQSGGSGLRRRGAVRGRVGNRLHPDNQPVVPHSTPPAQPPGSDARGHEEAQPPDVQDVNAGTRGDDPSRLTGPLDAPHVGDAGPVVDLSSLGEPSLGRDWRPADSQRGDASGSGDPFVDLSSLDGMPQSLAARASGTDVAGPNESGGSEQDSRTVQAESESEPASPIVGDHDGDPGSPVSPLDPDDSRPLWPSVDRGTGVSRGERSPEHEESLDVDLTQFAGEPPALYQGRST
ncbi:hypothetical protein ACFQ0O_28165 [Saccharopolyspora spinosporotrichia]